MKRMDIIFGAVVVALCLVLFLWRFCFQEQGTLVVVEVNGEEYGTYSLSEDQEIAIGDTNVLVISDGKAWMSDADCPDQLCVKQGKISANGEMIVCLPNRVTIQVSGGEDSEYDVIAY